MLFICKLIFHKSRPANIWNAKDLNEREMFNITSRTHVALPRRQDKAMTSSGLEPLGSAHSYSPFAGAGGAVVVSDFELFVCDNICPHTFREKSKR